MNTSGEVHKHWYPPLIGCFFSHGNNEKHPRHFLDVSTAGTSAKMVSVATGWRFVNPCNWFSPQIPSVFVKRGLEFPFVDLADGIVPVILIRWSEVMFCWVPSFARGHDDVGEIFQFVVGWWSHFHEG
jgi:hypothetical protein